MKSAMSGDDQVRYMDVIALCCCITRGSRGSTCALSQAMAADRSRSHDNDNAAAAAAAAAAAGDADADDDDDAFALRARRRIREAKRAVRSDVPLDAWTRRQYWCTRPDLLQPPARSEDEDACDVDRYASMQAAGRGWGGGAMRVAVVMMMVVIVVLMMVVMMVSIVVLMMVSIVVLMMMSIVVLMMVSIVVSIMAPIGRRPGADAAVAPSTSLIATTFSSFSPRPRAGARAGFTATT